MSYRVVIAPFIHDRIVDLVAEAASLGQGPSAPALRSLQERLSADPKVQGEIKYHLPSGVPVYSIAEAPFVFRYAVYEESQTVWVVKVDRLHSSSE